MKKIFSKTAFSLVELIIAMTLMSIIAFGIYSINIVLNNNNQDYGQKYSVKSATQITLNNILNNASLAVGNAGSDPNGNQELGILYGAAAIGNADPNNNLNTLCIHQDIPSGSALNTTTVNSPPSTPPTYANSRWLCYTFYGTGSNAFQIYQCAMPYTDSTNLPGSNRGAGTCNNQIPNPNGNISQGPVFLGTAYSISNVNGVSTPPVYSNGILSITIQNCLNDSISTCGGGANQSLSSNPPSNPEVQISGSIAASQESM